MTEPPKKTPAPRTVSFSLLKDLQGKRLDTVLYNIFPEYSRTSLHKSIISGMVRLENNIPKPATRVKAKQTITLTLPEQFNPFPQATNEKLFEIIHGEQEFLIIYKPAGVIVHPGDSREQPTTLISSLIYYYPELAEIGLETRPAIVHRLDKDTSGVMIIPRTEKTFEYLKKAFQERNISKKYLALVMGKPPQSGLIESPIGRNPFSRTRMLANAKRGKEAKTGYKLLRYYPKTNISLLSLTLFTGRTHQARVHLSSIHFPILGDKVYGKKDNTLGKQFPSLCPFLERQLLHAQRLTLTHPIDGKNLTYLAPLPEDFKDILKELLKIEKS
ncbi:MAG: RluA family pseudouridine synthase [Deltaproteobacteria bacterium]|jgi:23S rRNA pseudouridine1911/1915/1917 synthase|nr:RluA family pseudouridine synthase [Deltaproteobacteria bacterium]